ncbi:P22 phage major capsid protein family protein [Arthrobacter sp. GMC3]|uniref:P22 phage major capsid protein family protein n=1 Tax=Arthrobacter sp. GMC3 TaxID=2058894 RepID=UPI000CE574CB|nr:P22 phage major capsid protein family protein [Arthrobacter sp. GMC3]
MANVLYTPEQAAKATLTSLRWLTNLPRTVRQDFSTEFVAGRGQTVNVLGPINAGKAKVYTKANRTARASIEFNELGQAWFPVKLENQLYNAVRLPDDFATFTLENLTKQVLIPQAESVVDEIASPLITQMVAIATDASIPKVKADGSNIIQVLIKTRHVLNARHVTANGRYFAVGANIEAAILSLPQLQKANESGTTEVLREATIGRLFGFTILADPALPADFGIGYHSDAFAHVTRPSRAPEGAAKSASVAQDGFALRWIQHYNPLQLEDQSVVDTFFGATTLDATRAVSVAFDTTP